LPDCGTGGAVMNLNNPAARRPRIIRQATKYRNSVISAKAGIHK